MKTHISAIAILIFAGFSLVSCGAGGPSTTIAVAMTDFQFSPNNFTVPTGQEITVTAVNNGAVVHDFVLMKHGTTVGDKYDEEDLPNVYWKIELQPGNSTTTTFTAPAEPGEYQVVCGTKGHLEAGMIARLIVVTE